MAMYPVMHRRACIAISLFFLTDLKVYTNCLFVTLNWRDYIRDGSTTHESNGISLEVMSRSGPFSIDSVCIMSIGLDVES